MLRPTCAESRVFRGKFTAGLQQLFRQHKLQFHGSLQSLAGRSLPSSSAMAAIRSIATTCPAIIGTSETTRIKDCSTLGGVAGDHPYRHGLFPPIAMLQAVMREHIAPWDKGDKNNNHQAGFYIFRCRRIYLGGGA